MEKEAIRRKVRGRINQLTPGERSQESSKVMTKLLASPEFKKAKTIMFYCSTEDEIDTSEIIKAASNMGKKVAVPVTIPEERRLIPSCLIDYNRELVPGPYGILQPKPACIREIAPEDIDLVVVPGIAFDKEGNRLGRGAGYYDRFLAKIPENTPKIGLAFRFQLFSRLPRACHDLPVDKVLSA